MPLLLLLSPGLPCYTVTFLPLLFLTSYSTSLAVTAKTQMATAMSLLTAKPCLTVTAAFPVTGKSLAASAIPLAAAFATS